MHPPLLLIPLVIAYFIGSIPTGLILGKVFGAGDIRNIGSGNIGATNMMRTGRKDLAIATLLLDIFKGALVIWLCASPNVSPVIYWAGICVVLGHIFPIWLNFKGGKGVATTLGVLLAFSPIVGGIFILLWLGVFYFTRYSSLSAIIALGLSPIIAFLAGGLPFALMTLALSVTVIFKHKENISRLMQGTEGKWNKS